MRLGCLIPVAVLLAAFSWQPETRPTPVWVDPPTASIAPRATPQPTKPPRAVLGGVRATWYCLAGVSRCTKGYPGGHYAAISPDLAYLTGKRVRVCASQRCTHVTIIDCLCSRPYGIDLYADAFRDLAPLSLGQLTVTLG